MLSKLEQDEARVVLERMSQILETVKRVYATAHMAVRDVSEIQRQLKDLQEELGHEAERIMSWNLDYIRQRERKRPNQKLSLNGPHDNNAQCRGEKAS